MLPARRQWVTRPSPGWLISDRTMTSASLFADSRAARTPSQVEPSAAPPVDAVEYRKTMRPVPDRASLGGVLARIAATGVRLGASCNPTARLLTTCWQQPGSMSTFDIKKGKPG